jgi:hypothetical protein
MQIRFNINKISGVFLTCFLLSGCSDFLERSAQNLIIPETTAHYKEILQGEGYFQTIMTNLASWHYMTDDMEYTDVHTLPNCPPSWKTSKNGEDSKVDMYSTCYRWDALIEHTQFVDGSYMYLYKQIMVANVCLNGVDASEGTQSEKEILRGQAAFTRAFAYMMLANLYAKPYNKAAPNDLCVPVKSDPTPTLERFPRSTIAEVWNLIQSDVATALDNLKGKNLERNVYEISYPAALILATRVAMYMEDWDKVIEYGEEFLASFPQYSLYSISHQTTSGPRADNAQLGEYKITKFINIKNTELVWGFHWGSAAYDSYLFPISSETSVRYMAVSSRNSGNLIDVYEEGDRRKDYWFYPPANNGNYPSIRFGYATVKSETSPRTDIFQAKSAFRSAEIYLMLAEAYIRKSAPDKEKTVKALNDLRVKRFDASVYKPLSANAFSNEELINLVWLERRRELCFEELHRWWDLRRYPVQQPIVHRWRNGQTYTLQPDDPAYVLNFPQDELDYNGDILVPNVRPDRKAD